MNETTCLPPKKFERNEYGLICDGTVNYIYNEDGTINWRKMIKPEFLVPHKKFFEEKGLPIPTTVDGLEDKQVLILLGGLKELAQTRGYLSVTYKLTVPHEQYVGAVCEILWTPNYETYGKSVVFSAMADAHPHNTKSAIGNNFLAAMAENRAFCRAVRSFLKIHIVSADEVGGSTENEVPKAATSLLKEAMDKYRVPFSVIHAKLVEEKYEGVEKILSVDDLPVFKQLEFLERINKKAAERGQT